MVSERRTGVGPAVQTTAELGRSGASSTGEPSADEPSTSIEAATAKTSGPVSPGQRIVVLDGIRGFALFGVLMLNLLSYSGPTASFEPFAITDTWWDTAVEFVILVGGRDAFYSIFSFLFGVGVALQLQRRSSRAQPFVIHHLSRMAVLLGFGILHTAFLWHNDILANYAIAGCFLLLFVNRHPETLLKWSAGLVGSASVSTLIFGTVVAAQNRVKAGTPEEIEANVNWYRSADFWDLAAHRSGQLHLELFQGFAGSVWFVGLFLAGMWALQTGKVKDWQNQRGFLLNVLRVSVPVMVVGKGFYALLIVNDASARLNPLADFVSSTVGGPAQGATYVCLILLILQRRADAGALRYLAPVGRMALTNYLVQSAVAVTVFYGFGLGLYGRFALTQAVALGTTFFGLQIVASAWWLNHFRFGPLEWLWRKLTYRLQAS